MWFGGCDGFIPVMVRCGGNTSVTFPCQAVIAEQRTA
jgi:hypothetical protein